MARTDKPYRVYRGGRVKGRVPLERRPAEQFQREPDGKRRYREPGPRRWRPRWSWRRGIVLVLGVLVLLFLVWAVGSYLAFSSGVHAANKRLPRKAKAALTPQHGLLLSHPTAILVLGTDHAKSAERIALRHSDSMMIVRTDPDHHRLAYVSILRDLRVEVPGYGTQKINAAYQFGGARLAIKTVREVTQLPVNHVVIVDFANFERLIDDLGGVTVDVPAPVLSNRFDCPYSARRCASWQGWRFPKGKQHMDGQRALVYSRIRENRLNPADSDATRAGRQQQVIQAIGGKITSPGTMLRLPFVGGHLLRPVATDLSPAQLLQLGWVKFRAGDTLHCRLGGTASGGYILRDEEFAKVLLMIQGKSAPQPPLPGSLYGSGCSKKLGAG
jgi:polyisoprenyl-teichoic acid--peptidoglycan teichoic acid transferase